MGYFLPKSSHIVQKRGLGGMGLKLRNMNVTLQKMNFFQSFLLCPPTECITSTRSQPLNFLASWTSTRRCQWQAPQICISCPLLVPVKNTIRSLSNNHLPPPLCCFSQFNQYSILLTFHSCCGNEHAQRSEYYVPVWGFLHKFTKPPPLNWGVPQVCRDT